ncbi:hypothetical protein [Xanthomonas hortorum]|uniref:hypothetical protein n=1 Tax=Xanthomonas hortorum TaxID=56454 RepID=UPI000A5303C1|nr:hypothetical protein [Xanthomonas hortorum]
MSDIALPEALEVSLTPDELRYLVACGAALLQNIPESSLPTYSQFSKEQIISFSGRIRRIMDEHGLGM